jgi:hypothetical protein
MLVRPKQNLHRQRAQRNVAGLFVARGLAREREISTRLALGASPGRIGRQLLADSVLLSLAGGLLGLALAPIVMRTLIAFLPHDTAANALQSAVDARLLAFACASATVSGRLRSQVIGCHETLGAAPHLASRSGSRGALPTTYLRRCDGNVQFSRDRPRTRSNSAILFVTSVNPIARAWPAMNRSLAPIIAPRLFRSARISA